MASLLKPPASNLISGLFLIGEHAIEIDDLIEIDGIIGHVVSVDLLSTKLRTRDYLMVRIPNEKMVQATIINFSRLPIRRLDVMIGMAYKENIGDVRRILLETADRNPLSLEEPEAEVMFVGFGDSSIDLRFSVWVTKDNFLALKIACNKRSKKRWMPRASKFPFLIYQFMQVVKPSPYPCAMLKECRLRWVTH